MLSILGRGRHKAEYNHFYLLNQDKGLEKEKCSMLDYQKTCGWESEKTQDALRILSPTDCLTLFYTM